MCSLKENTTTSGEVRSEVTDRIRPSRGAMSLSAMARNDAMSAIALDESEVAEQDGNSSTAIKRASGGKGLRLLRPGACVTCGRDGDDCDLLRCGTVRLATG